MENLLCINNRRVRMAIMDEDESYIDKIIEIISDNNLNIDVIVLKNSDDLLINLNEFEIIMIDVGIKMGKGIETAIKAKKIKPNVLILFSACNSVHALEAYKASPYRYILKADLHELYSAIEDSINYLIMNEKKVLIHIIRGRDIYINLQKICYLEAYSHTVRVYLKESVLDCKGTVGDYEKILFSEGFIRVNKKQLINARHVVKLIDSKAVMSNLNTINISRRRKQAVKTTLLEVSGIL